MPLAVLFIYVIGAVLILAILLRPPYDNLHGIWQHIVYGLGSGVVAVLWPLVMVLVLLQAVLKGRME